MSLSGAELAYLQKWKEELNAEEYELDKKKSENSVKLFNLELKMNVLNRIARTEGTYDVIEGEYEEVESSLKDLLDIIEGIDKRRSEIRLIKERIQDYIDENQ